MVYFTCNHCGEALKKQAVEKHAGRCRRPIFVTCPDCLKDFKGQEYDLHSKCLSEEERYSGKDFIPKASKNKGEKKQTAWVDMIREIVQSRKDLNPSVKNALNKISTFENVPRKKPKFINFLKNSVSGIRFNDSEMVWKLLEDSMNANKPANVAKTINNDEESNGIVKSNGVDTVEENNNEENNADNQIEVKKSKKKKMKLDNDLITANGKCNNEVKELDENAVAAIDVSKSQKKKKRKAEQIEEVTDNEPDSKKAKQDDTNEINNNFNWNETIIGIINKSTSNQMQIDKLKKKVFKKYLSVYNIDEINGKIEKKFNKKLAKLNTVELTNDIVKLITN